MTGSQDLSTVVEVLTNNVQVLAENLYIPLIASIIIGGIVSFLPKEYRPLGFIVSIVISTLIVFLAVKSGEVEANGYSITLMGLMLGGFTSGGYSLVKKVFSKEEVSDKKEGQKENPVDSFINNKLS